jgi:signal transduction histidine kinase
VTSRWLAAWRRNRLFRRYVVPFVGVVLLALLSNGLLEMYFAYQENKVALARIQREKAAAAALRIEAFVKEIERQMAWTTQPYLAATGALEQRRLDYFRLQRQVPAITEVSYLDPSGREQLRISRLAMDVIESRVDLSSTPRFTETRGGATWYGPVYFRKDSEPYMAIAIPHGKAGAVTAAEVNLKFILDVVSQIRIGKFGHAYVVDAGGHLIAHPDISLVLKKTDLSELPQIRAARAAQGAATEGWDAGMIATSLDGRRSLVAHTTIAPLGWLVVVEQPLIEAFAPLRGSIVRTGLLMLLGVLVSIAASLVLAGKMTRPIRALHTGAARIGGGDLAHQIDIRTRDELEDLAGEFNRMTARLRESYATLEQRVEERTRELSEALDQQTATAEVLRVISRSPTDVQPVLEAVADSAARVCGATDAIILRVENGLMRRVAHVGPVPLAMALANRPLTSRSVAGRAILECRAVHVDDILDPLTAREYPESPVIPGSGIRTTLAVPLLREASAIGAIIIRRPEVRPFSDKQVALLQTFADQAVIAIENVRLFKELESRNAALTESLSQQTATAEILRVISASPTDIQPVFDTIVRSAVRLCNAATAAVFRTDGGMLYHPANYGGSAEMLAAVRARFPRPLDMASLPGVAILTRAVVQVPDIEAPSTIEFVRDIGRVLGFRSVVAVPMFREGEAVGAIVVARYAPGRFSDGEVELLRTFTDQAVIAIENVRLFEEIQDKTRQLEAANRHKDEFLASMSHELRTPLNAVIGFSEVLLERMFGELNDKQEEYLNDILVSGRHLLSLINDILDLAKIEAGRMELDLEDFDVAQAVDNAVVLVRERAMRKGLALETALAPALGSVRADQRKVKQVLLNLLSNAIKFTPEGGRIEVRAQRLDGLVEVSVSDTGIGIAHEDQEAVFEEFRQVGTDYAKKHEGTGLGLTLSRKFVELHGGSIAVKSRVGEGSTFTFTIPVRTWRAS